MGLKSCILRGALAAALLTVGQSVWAQEYIVSSQYLLEQVTICTNTGCQADKYWSAAEDWASRGGYPQAIYEESRNVSNPDTPALDLIVKWRDVNGWKWRNRYSNGGMYYYPDPYMDYYGLDRGTNGNPTSRTISIGSPQPFEGQYTGAWIACNQSDAWTWHCWYGTGGPGWSWSVNLYYSRTGWDTWSTLNQ